ncbi:MAG: hypothetical protein GY697_20970 [Desulfobacterales bacterium]|nr:hypothetical protein [Desulfobacterales bacterium]
MNWHRLTVLIPLIFFQISCAAITKKSDLPVSPEGPGKNGASLAVLTESINQTLVSSRGIGWIAFTHSGQLQRLRIAWVSAVPEKLRVVLLGADGRPLVTISADGTWFYFQDHTTGEFRKDSPLGYRLKAALHLPLDVRSLSLLLAGRLPPIDYDRTELLPGRTPDETVIVLKKWWNMVGRVYISNSRSAIARIESYRQTGEMRYQADIKETQKVKTYVVPRVLSINDKANNQFVLDIERYWANEPVSPEVFRLDPPEK